MLLAVALEQEEELGLEGMLLRILVELSEKRVLLDLLQKEPRPELRGETSGEGRFADTNRTLDRDVSPRRPVRAPPPSLRRPNTIGPEPCPQNSVL